MRIAHIVRKYDPKEWGGTESYLKNLFSVLKVQHADSMLFAPSINPSTTYDPIVSCGIELRRFRAIVPYFGLSPFQKSQIIAVGGNILSFNLPWMLFRENNIDLIHIHALGRLGGIGRTIARLRHLPFIVSIHGGAFDIPPQVEKQVLNNQKQGWDWGKPFGWLFGSHHVLSDADAILTLNETETKKIQERFPSKKVIQMPSGIYIKSFEKNCRDSAVNAFPEIKNRPLFLMAGRIDPVKNQLWVVQQVPEILKKHPDILFVIAGGCTNTEYKDSITKQISDLKIQNSVIFVGDIKPDDPKLIGLYQLSTALLLPSLSETFGLVILEAWAASTVVISSKTSGALEKIISGKNGLLFDLENPKSFHDAVDSILSNPLLTSTIKNEGQKCVKAKYDIEKTGNRLKELYESLIEEKKR